MISSLSPSTKKRAAAYTAVVLLLIIGRIFVDQSGWFGSPNLHMLMEFMAASLALFVGALALVRFYTRQNSVYFFIGTGFIGAGLLDAYHAMTTATTFDLLATDIFTLDFWQWNPSPTFLSLLMAGSWFIWQRKKSFGDTTRQYYLIVALVAAVSVVAFTIIPQPPIDASIYLPGRVMAILNTVFFLIALIGYLNKGEWRQDTFENWLLSALIVLVVAQRLFRYFA